MENLKLISKAQENILKKSESILYSVRFCTGNMIEKEVIKHCGIYYRVCATNKYITEFTEV